MIVRWGRASYITNVACQSANGQVKSGHKVPVILQLPAGLVVGHLWIGARMHMHMPHDAVVS